MANKHRGEIAIQLDKKRKLKFNTNALAELEDALGHSLSKLGENEVGIKTMIKMFWAGMLHEMPELTLKEAADLMDHSDFTTISEKVAEALSVSFGNVEGKNDKSGPSGAGKN